MPQALADLKVLEFGDFISAPYCGKLFADLLEQGLALLFFGADEISSAGHE